MTKTKKVYVITPIYITYTEKLNEVQYRAEIKAVMNEIKNGAREWAYSTQLREGKTRVVKSLLELEKKSND